MWKFSLRMGSNSLKVIQLLKDVMILKRYPKNKLTYKRLLTKVSVLRLLSCVAAFFIITVPAQAIEIVEGTYEVIDTDVQHSEFIGRHFLGQWLDDQKLLINTFSDEPGAQLKKYGQVVLFDAKTKNKSILFDNLTLQCTNPISHVSMLKNFVNNEVKFFNIREDGHLTDLTKAISVEEFKCFDRTEVKPERLQVFLLDGESYIDRGKTGNGGIELAVLYHKNKQPVELGIHGYLFDYFNFIPFKNKYLINNSDITAKNGYNGHMEEEPNFYYMSVDGQVEKIPQPVKFQEQVGDFSSMFPMRDGMILKRTGIKDKTSGLYYLKGDKIIRIYGKSPLIPIRGVIDTPYTNYHLVSPDGCSIAFVSYLSLNFDAKKPVKIINLCQEK